MLKFLVRLKVWHAENQVLPQVEVSIQVLLHLRVPQRVQRQVTVLLDLLLLHHRTLLLLVQVMRLLENPAQRLLMLLLEAQAAHHLELLVLLLLDLLLVDHHRVQVTRLVHLHLALLRTPPVLLLLTRLAVFLVTLHLLHQVTLHRVRPVILLLVDLLPVLVILLLIRLVHLHLMLLATRPAPLQVMCQAALLASLLLEVSTLVTNPVTVLL
jgi:hypothetical protein